MIGFTKAKTISQRLKHVLLATLFVATQFVVPLSASDLFGATAAATPDDTPKKVFVCKYVGTPHVDERLQTGDNPINVSINAIQNNQWDGTVPGWFSDAHDRSYVLAYDVGQDEPDVSECPAPEGPKEVEVPATPSVNDPCGPRNATWVIPEDTESVVWSVYHGDLIAKTTKGYIFEDQTTMHNFGKAKDSNVECPAVGSITIKKNAINDSKQVFHFTTSGLSTDGTGFDLVDDSTPGLPSKSFSDIPAGSTYKITESATEGWKLDSLHCSEPGYTNSKFTYDGSMVSIELAKDEHVTCTFTNREIPRGSITIIKNTIGGDGTFTFTSDFGVSELTTEENTASQKVEDLLPGTYAISENVPEGWDLTSAVCDDQSDPSAIKLSENENVTCTFTNTKKPELGKVFGFKWNDGNGNGEKDKYEQNLSNWKILLFKKGEQSSHYYYVGHTYTNQYGFYHFNDLKPGTYKVCEKQQYGWVQTYPGGETKCHIVEFGREGGKSWANFGNQGRGSITVIKKVDDGYGNVSYGHDWTWNYWGKYQSGKYEKASYMNHEAVPAGKYLVSENNKHGYHFTSVKCFVPEQESLLNQQFVRGEESENEEHHYGNDGKTFVYVKPGQHVVCVFLNTRDTGSLTVVKDATPNDEQWFNFTVEMKNKCEYRKPPVFQDVRELVSLNTFQSENEYEEVPECEPMKTVDEFELQDYEDEENSTHTTKLESGWYKVTEGAVEGWVLEGIDCGEAKSKIVDNSVWVYVGPRHDVTCTYSNTKLGTVTITKDVQPDSKQAFSFSTDLNGGSTFELTDDSTLPGLASKIFTNVAPGVYTVTEDSIDGWTLDNISCDAGATASVDGNVLTLTVAPGDNVECTFVNVEDPAGNVLGESTKKPQVLGEELVNTGQSAIVNVVAGLLIITLAIASRWFVRPLTGKF